MSAGHSHAPASADAAGQPPSPRIRRLTLALLVPAAAVTLVAMIMLWPHPDNPTEAPPPDRVNGEVTAVQPVDCAENPDTQVPAGEETPAGPAAICGTVTVRLTSGPDAGKDITTDIPTGPGAITVADGDDIELLYLPDSPDGQRYSIYDQQRSTQLWILAAAFALAVIAFGRWRGLTALFGLGVTFAVLLWFVVPAILEGRSPLLVAIVGSAAIMLTVLYLTHGFHPSTTVAVAGTLAALTITAVLSALATTFTHLSGIADETSSYLNITHADVNMQGLLLAGIVIGSLGVLDDVTVTQATAVTELARANPNYGYRQLYRAAERIGRAHIASVINTIVLAYAGASLPLMLLFAAGNNPVGDTITSELIAQELVRSAVGTLGLIAAVPITTALAAATARNSPPLVADPKPVPAAGPVAGSAPAGDPWMAFLDRRDDSDR
jgi:uncharacterized membrane protein